MSNVVAEAGLNRIPVGYKQTEVGVIPEDWDISCFSDCGYFQSGSGFPTKYQGEQEGDYPFFKVSDMNNIGNENILRTSNNYISENIRNLIAAKIIPVNAIIFAKIGAAIFLERKKICFQPSCIDNNLMAYIVNNDKLYYKYAYLLFKNINLGHLVEATALPSLSSRDIGQKKIAFPAMEEQTIITNALSDVDALITELEKLITKKQAIKTATMQQLLTGRTRLPQFALREDGSKKGTKQIELGEIPEDWDISCFSDCGYFQSGSGFPTKYQGEQEGDYPFFKVSDMNNIGNENILRTSNNYISENIRNLIAAKIIPVNAIIFAKIGAAIFLERKKICFQPSCIDNNLMAYIVNNDKLYYKYAYLLFKNINLGHLVEATALPSLSSHNIGLKKVAVPAMEEQTAIATILSDMDEEIQALEQRLSKTHQIKQGMMQELLTGRTRLV